jgi:hypothetical protein
MDGIGLAFSRRAPWRGAPRERRVYTSSSRIVAGIRGILLYYGRRQQPGRTLALLYRCVHDQRPADADDERDWFTLRRLELRLNLSHERLRPSFAPKGVTDANTSRPEHSL